MIDKTKVAQKGIKILDNTKDSNPLEEMLKTHFPQTIKEGQVSLNAIAALLGKDLSNMQGYELTFTGKGLANALYTTPCQKVLKHKEIFRHCESFPCHSEEARATEESPKEIFRFTQNDKKDTNSCHSEPALAGEESQNEVSSSLPHLSPKEESQTNTLIIGDNLDVLKLLKSAYSEKIKMIYIDPPYNTGGDNFIYPDDFREDYKAILREVGLLERDENNNEVESETLRFFKNITGSKSHSGWLSFMLPRLKLARDLLKEDGVIFMSIDDNEQADLKLLCDEIFGEENFVACMPRITKKAGKSTDKVANNHDYVLCYYKNDITFKQIEVSEENYKERDEHFGQRGGYKLNQTLDYDSLQYNKKMDFEVEIDGVKYYPGGYEKFLDRKNGKFGRIDWVWRWSKDKFDFGLENNFIEIRNNRIYTKTYFKAKISDKKPYNIEYIDRTKNVSSIELLENKYSNDNANKNLQEIFGQKNIFDYSKSAELIKFLISQISTSANSNDIILDFFAGSGTTAQAVMELNAEDGGNRQFILVQIDEPINEEKSKAAYDFCKNELKSENPTISDITIERVKRAAKKINANICLNIFTLESKPELIGDETSLKLEANADLSALDKAINLALSAGKTLSQTLQVVIEDKLYKCEDSYFCIECDKGVFETLAKTSDEYIYLDGFMDMNLESFLNLDAQFKERLNIVY